MVDIEILENNYYVNGFDVPYELKKGDKIYIKPILLKDYPIYEWAKQVLEIRKNEINDIEVIQMSYLDFLIEYVFQSNEDHRNKLQWLLKLCLNEEYIAFQKQNDKNCILICDEQGYIQKIITAKEFDEISKIILSQNDINYDDRYVNPEVREMLQEYYNIKYKDTNMPNLEKKKGFVCSKTGKSFSELNEITYREFCLIYEACKDSEIYFGEKIIQASYKYEVKEEVKHPLFRSKSDPYAELFEDTSVLASKGISGAEGLNAMNIQNIQGGQN